MKRFLPAIGASLLVLLGSGSLAYAASIFTSAQVGSSPTNGYVLQTNGQSSTWVATSTLGISGTGGVSSFNTRTGSVTLSSGDVTTALGYTPSSFSYPFQINATSTLLNFNGGLTAFASSTIGNGTATSGLTVNGGATTTGDVIFYPNGEARGGFVIDYNNPASTTPNVSHEDSLTLIGDDNDFPAIYQYAYHFRALDECYSADGTLGNPTNTKSGSELCRFGGRGYDGTSYTGTTAAVSLFAGQDWTNTSQPGWVAIRTTPIGSTGGGSQQIPPITAAFTMSGGLIVGSTTAAGGSQFTYSPSNFAFYATDPGNGNILANGITTVNATTTNATTTTLTLLGTTACNTGNALTTNALGNVVCGTTGSGSGTVGSGTTGQFPYYAASGTTLTATSSLFLAASGNVGIGNTAPLFPLHVSSNGSSSLGQISLTDTNAVSSAATWLLSSQGGVFSIGTTTAAGATTTPSAISISNTGMVGIDSVVAPNTALNIAYTFPSGAGNKQGISSFPVYTGTSSAARVIGTITQATFSGAVNGTNINGSAVGGNFMAINGTNGQNVLNAYAALGQFATVGALSSTTNVADFEAQAPNTLAGTTITNYYGLQTQGATTTGAGPIANAVGVNIQLLNFTNTANQTSLLIGTSTAPAGNFGIYQFDTKNNYLAGNLGVGTTSPYAALSVVSNISTLFAIATSSGIAPVLTLDNFGFLSEAGGDKPTVTSCGTGSSVATGSNDNRGAITEGTIATGCVITFPHPIPANSFCTMDSESGLAFSYSNSNTAITITNIGALSSTQINYQCD